MEPEGFSIEELEAISKQKKKERAEHLKKLEELTRLKNLPFYLRIQEKGQEIYLQGFEERQKEAFLTHSVPKWKIPKEEGLELFQEFFTEFLRGEVKSIYDFLTGRGYKKYN